MAAIFSLIFINSESGHSAVTHLYESEAIKALNCGLNDSKNTQFILIISNPGGEKAQIHVINPKEARLWVDGYNQVQKILTESRIK